MVYLIFCFYYHSFNHHHSYFYERLIKSDEGILKHSEVICNVIFIQQKEIKMNGRKVKCWRNFSGLPHFLPPAGLLRSDERWTQRNWQKQQQQQQSCLKKLTADSLPEEVMMFLRLVRDGGHHSALWPLQCAWGGPERLRDSSGSASVCWLSCLKNLIMDPCPVEGNISSLALVSAFVHICLCKNEPENVSQVTI